MGEISGLAERFEQQRPRLRTVAYRMLGSLDDAEDAVQETWLRCAQSDSQAVVNLSAWLTTIVARVSLNMLRARKSRRPESIETYVPDPIVNFVDGFDPEKPVLLGEAVGLALMVVLETLAPTERIAFVLHDMFSVSFEQIAPIVERTPAAARKLASRARHRIAAPPPIPATDLARQREIVDAFFAAARDGDFDRLVGVLDPDIVLRSDGGTQRPSVLIRGADNVAARAVGFARLGASRKPALTNGAAGVLILSGGKPFSVMGFTVVGSRIVEINVLADPERLGRIGLPVLDAGV